MEINNESQNKKRLGRGLGSLLGNNATHDLAEYPKVKQAEQEVAQTKASEYSQEKTNVDSEKDSQSRVWQIAIDKLVPGIYQPRKNFDKAALEELSASIKQSGIIQPITVRKRAAGGYEIIAGERRWRAAQLAGLHEVPAIIIQATNKDALQIALIENIQRENLDPIEEAESYQRLIEEFSYSQNEIAEKVGKERSTVTNSLRLLILPKEIKEMVTQKTISQGHAKVLLSIADKSKQTLFAKKIVEKNLSVRALELAIKQDLEDVKNAEVSIKSELNINIAEKLALELADQLQRSLGTKVAINYKAGKGSVSVSFYTDEQLTTIYEKLKA